jgi:hypothetical protein
VAEGIVLELQRDCLDPTLSTSTILRKAKAIASKLELQELQAWIGSELNGYDCSMEDLPEHRKGVGAPKFKNPYHGWCPIITDDGWFGDVVRTVFLPQPVSELEGLVAGGDTDWLIMQYNPSIQRVLQKQMVAPMECALHFSKATITSALDFVRNKALDWTLELERRSVVGEGFSFKETDKKEAKMVTNHIYGGNIGVIGNVSGDVENSRFVNSSGVDKSQLQDFLDQATPAAAGLDASTRAQVDPILSTLSAEANGEANPGKVKSLINSLRKVLEGAGGNLVASALLAALTGVQS